MLGHAAAAPRKRARVDTSSRYELFETPAAAPRSVGSTATGDTPIFLAALVENRAFEVGIACIELRSNHMMLTQVGDNQNYSSTLAMLAQYSPAEIIISNKARTTKLGRLLHAAMPHCTLADIERKYFNDTDGMAFFNDADRVVLHNVTSKELEHKYLCAAAANALHKYCDFVQRTRNMLTKVS